VIFLVRRTHGGPILRAAVFLALTLSVAGTMICIAPVAAYYSVAQYAYAGFDYEVNGVFSTADLDRLRTHATGGALASFLLVHPASLTAAAGSAAGGRPISSSATVLFADSGSDLEASWFTDATVVGRSANPGEAWVDLSATLALRLGVSPGDVVRVALGPGFVTGRVRRIVASAFQGGPMAVAPRTASVDRLLPEAAGISGLVTLQTTESATAIARVATSSGSAPGRTTEAQVRSRVEALTDARRSGGVVGDGLRLLTTLGALLFLGLAIREGHAVVSRRADALAIAVAVGARRRSVLLALVTMEVVAAAAVGLIVWWAIRSVGFGSIFPDAWPPRLDGLLAMGVGTALVGYVLTVLVVGLRSFSYERLLSTVREGRSL